MIEPKPPTGSDAKAAWCRWAHDQIKRLTPMDVSGVQMGRTTRGNYQINPPPTKKQSLTLFELLTHAVWKLSVRKIYGCRGGYIFEFDDSGNWTGNSLAFADPYLGESYLALDGNGDLWASYWSDFGAGEKQSSKGFYQIKTEKLVTVKFIPFYPPRGITYSTDPLSSLSNASAYNTGPWPSTGPPSLFVNADLATPYNTGAAIGDAFFHCTAANGPWLGTFGPAPAAYDFYLQTVISGSSPIQIWYALDRAATPSDTPIDIFTQPTGRTNVIVHVPLGSQLSLNIPATQNFHCVFGCTGTITTSSTIGYLNNIFGIGPRRIGFGSNGHLYCTFLDCPIATGGGFAARYQAGSASPGVGAYEIDPSTGLIVNTLSASNDVNGTPGVNCFWLDATANELWCGNDMGLQNATLGTGFFEVPAFISFTNGWYSGAVYGADYVPSNDLFYMATASNIIATCPKSSPSNGSVSTFTISQRPDMSPRNIRLSPINGHLYIPTMRDNCVIELDPSSNTVVNVFNNFDCPWDIVFTDAKVFAIQLGKIGLKEVK